MIKATAKHNGRDALLVGLSFANLDRFRAEPADTYITIKGDELGLSHDVIIFSGRTEADLLDLLSSGFRETTKVAVSDRLKN
jgi:hypothetical protein